MKSNFALVQNGQIFIAQILHLSRKDKFYTAQNLYSANNAQVLYLSGGQILYGAEFIWRKIYIARIMRKFYLSRIGQILFGSKIARIRHKFYICLG